MGWIRVGGSIRSAVIAVGLLVAGGCSLNDRLLESVADPVCGRTVGKREAVARRELLRRVYYFDSEDCAREFDAHPARYCDVASTMYPEYDY